MPGAHPADRPQGARRAEDFPYIPIIWKICIGIPQSPFPGIPVITARDRPFHEGHAALRPSGDGRSRFPAGARLEPKFVDFRPSHASNRSRSREARPPDAGTVPDPSTGRGVFFRWHKRFPFSHVRDAGPRHPTHDISPHLFARKFPGPIHPLAALEHPQGEDATSQRAARWAMSNVPLARPSGPAPLASGGKRHYLHLKASSLGSLARHPGAAGTSASGRLQTGRARRPGRPPTPKRPSRGPAGRMPAGSSGCPFRDGQRRRHR